MLIVADERWLSDYTTIEIGSALSVVYFSMCVCVCMVPVKDVYVWIGHAAVSGALCTYFKILVELLPDSMSQYIENITSLIFGRYLEPMGEYYTQNQTKSHHEQKCINVKTVNCRLCTSSNVEW